MRSLGAYVGVAAAGLARTCLSDSGMLVRLGRSPGTPEETLVATATKIAHAQPAIVTETTPQSLQRQGRTTPIRSVLLDRTGQYDELGVPALAANEALSPNPSSGSPRVCTSTASRSHSRSVTSTPESP